MRSLGLVMVLAVSALVGCGSDGTSERTTITGGSWEWQETRTADDSVVAPGDSTKYTLSLGSVGTVEIRADCNRASGTYVLEGNRLTIAIGPTTRAQCSMESLSNEYVRQLGEVDMQTVDQGELTLSLSSAGAIMRFGSPS